MLVQHVIRVFRIFVILMSLKQAKHYADVLFLHSSSGTIWSDKWNTINAPGTYKTEKKTEGKHFA